MKLYKKYRKDLVALVKVLDGNSEEYIDDFVMLYEVFIDFVKCDWNDDSLFKHRKQSLLSTISFITKHSKTIKEINVDLINNTMKLYIDCRIISKEEIIEISKFHNLIGELENFNVYSDEDSEHYRLFADYSFIIWKIIK